MSIPKTIARGMSCIPKRFPKVGGNALRKNVIPQPLVRLQQVAVFLGCLMEITTEAQ
jgi:hypothetical protein